MPVYNSKERAPRILVVKLSSVGDILHALPTVNALKRYMNAEIDWVVQHEYVDLVDCFPDVNRVISFPRKNFRKRGGAFLRELRSQDYHLVIDLQGLLKSALVAKLARAPRKIGPSFNREGARFFYHEIAGECDLMRHAVIQNLDVLKVLGLEVPDPVFNVSFPKPALDGPRPWIGMAPNSRWPSKDWPADHFAALAKRLLASVGGTVFFIGGTGDREVCANLVRATGAGSVNVAGLYTLAESGGVMAQLDVLVANDSGPAHLGCAAGVPTIALFAPTEPKRTGPFGPDHTVIRALDPCFACYDRNCRRQEGGCMATITPARVAVAVESVLKKRAPVRAKTKEMASNE